MWMIGQSTAKNQIWLWLAVALLCTVEVIALGVFYCWHLSRTAFWYDESMQVWMSLGVEAFGRRQARAGSFRDVIHQNAVTKLDPGGFTIIVWLWLKLATGEVWQRALRF